MSDQESGGIHGVDLRLDSGLESVDTAEAEALEVARKMGFEEDDLHKIGVAVRECVVNAVVHGNRYSARKKVHFQVIVSPDRLTVITRDEGEGFELTSLPDPLAEENLLRQSGRGMLLIRAFMDEVRIEPVSPGGTQVTMTKTLAPAS